MTSKPPRKDKRSKSIDKNKADRKDVSTKGRVDSTLPKASQSKVIASQSKAIAPPKAAAAVAPSKRPPRQPSDLVFKELTKMIAKQRQSEEQNFMKTKSIFPKGFWSIGQANEQHAFLPKFKLNKIKSDPKSVESRQSTFGSKPSALSLEPQKLSFESKPSFVSKQSIIDSQLSSFESKKTLFIPKPSPKLAFVSKRPLPPPPLLDKRVQKVDKRERKTDVIGIKKPGETIKQKRKVKNANLARMIRKFREPKFIDQADLKSQRKSCRICFSSQCNKKTGDLIVPCNCRGIFSTVHQRCISDWIVAMCSDTCDICRFKFFIRAKHKGLTDFITEEQQFQFIWQTLIIVCFSLYLILIASAFVQVVELYGFLTDAYELTYKIACSILIFLLLCYVGYHLAERAIAYRVWRKYKYHITVKPNPNYRISEIITPPFDIIRSSGLGQYSIKPLIRPVL